MSSLVERALNFGIDLLQAMKHGRPSWRQVFDREYMAAYGMFQSIEPGAVKVLVDIGACEGLYSSRASRYFQLERIIAVEPLAAQAQRLRTLDLPGLVVVQKACTDAVGVSSFHVNRTQQASSLLTINPGAAAEFGLDLTEQSEIGVETTTLDALAEELNLSSIDLLKIDVQGAERALLSGAAVTLPRVRFLQIEVLFIDHYLGCAQFPELHQILTSQGFRLRNLSDVTLNERGQALQADAVYENTRGASTDVSRPVMRRAGEELR